MTFPNNKPKLIVFKLHNARVALRSSRHEPLPDEIAALALTGGSVDFEKRRKDWKLWWNRPRVEFPDFDHPAEWVSIEDSPFLVEADDALAPDIIWSLLGDDARLYIVLTNSWYSKLGVSCEAAPRQLPSQTTFTLKYGSPNDAAQSAWQREFFKIDSRAIALGFNGRISDLELGLQNTPDQFLTSECNCDLRFSHPIIESAADNDVSRMLDTAAFVLLPYGGEHHDGLILSKEYTVDQMVEMLVSALGDRLNIIVVDGDDKYTAWVKQGRLV